MAACDDGARHGDWRLVFFGQRGRGTRSGAVDTDWLYRRRSDGVLHTVRALRMTVASPEVGSFRAHAAKAFGPGMGFVVGWVYWTGMALAMSSEATAVSILLRQWIPGVSLPLAGSIIIVAVMLFNLLRRGSARQARERPRRG